MAAGPEVGSQFSSKVVPGLFEVMVETEICEREPFSMLKGSSTSLNSLMTGW